jgi:adhesin/invasin
VIYTSKSTLIADGVDKATIHVELRDKSGHSIAGRKVWLSSDPAGYKLTDANGKAEFTVSHTELGTVSYYVNVATSNGLNIILLGIEDILYVPGELSVEQSSIEASLYSVKSDGSESSVITVTLRDNNRHPIDQRLIRLEADGGHSEIDEINAWTDAQGKARFEVANRYLETVLYTAYDDETDAVLGSVSITYIKGDANSAQSTIEADRTEVKANGEKVTITVTLRDAGGNPLEGREVELMFVQGATRPYQDSYSVVTDESGQAFFQVWTTVIGPVRYAAYADGVQIDGYVDLNFVVDDYDPEASYISASPSYVEADGVKITELIVHVNDASGNPIDGREVRIRALNGHSWYGNWLGMDTETTSRGQGAYFTARNFFVEDVTYEAYDVITDELIGTVVVHFVPGEMDMSKSVVESTSTHITANGSDASTIRVTLRDKSNHPIPDREVVLQMLSDSIGMQEITAVTDAKGEAVFMVAHTVAETVQVTPMVDYWMIFDTVTVHFVPGELDFTKSSMTVSAYEVYANDTDEVGITVKLVDANENGLEGRKVLLHASDPNVIRVIAENNGLTDSQGMVTFTVTGNWASTVEFTRQALSSSRSMSHSKLAILIRIPLSSCHTAPGSLQLRTQPSRCD